MEPLAVRSSSLLEDSQYQPFAGVYETYMIPNNDPNPDERLLQLLRCIKLVYASTYSRSARDYMKATSYRLEEEKMAVIIQRMVGSPHNERFYPDFAGVAKSHNFYPDAAAERSGRYRSRGARTREDRGRRRKRSPVLPPLSASPSAVFVPA